MGLESDGVCALDSGCWSETEDPCDSKEAHIPLESTPTPRAWVKMKDSTRFFELRLVLLDGVGKEHWVPLGISWPRSLARSQLLTFSFLQKSCFLSTSDSS